MILFVLPDTSARNVRPIGGIAMAVRLRRDDDGGQEGGNGSQYGISKLKQMITLLKESTEIKRAELADAKEEIRRLQGRTKEIEKSIKRFEKLIQAARS